MRVVLLYDALHNFVSFCIDNGRQPLRVVTRTVLSCGTIFFVVLSSSATSFNQSVGSILNKAWTSAEMLAQSSAMLPPMFEVECKRSLA